MSLNSSTRVFFDASCLYAAARSRTGGSAALLDICAQDFLEGIVSPMVLSEAERNIIAQESAAVYAIYQGLISTTPLQIVSTPSLSHIAQYQTVFFEDAHVIASALAAQADYLITLDKPFHRRAQETNVPIPVVSPAEFLQQALPTHEDYHLIRPSL